ncbi:putative integral membrane protein [Babesia bovis T2Bo]|uniref:Uncharacterized protein n=1 Tax=Babesia bovis TaxID=5865 RepID=A7AMD0_BABBO|nr:putative integral membrane protein [Babesia bovis T2Bo]EDO07714.1 putative integral membrane protein [Babesia bovis T2Bo]|eukprot:XP_001611282.1 hypothetical protein [Babesia bovis T2Bo]
MRGRDKSSGRGSSRGRGVPPFLRLGRGVPLQFVPNAPKAGLPFPGGPRPPYPEAPVQIRQSPRYRGSPRLVPQRGIGTFGPNAVPMHPGFVPNMVPPMPQRATPLFRGPPLKVCEPPQGNTAISNNSGVPDSRKVYNRAVVPPRVNNRFRPLFVKSHIDLMHEFDSKRGGPRPGHVSDTTRNIRPLRDLDVRHRRVIRDYDKRRSSPRGPGTDAAHNRRVGSYNRGSSPDVSSDSLPSEESPRSASLESLIDHSEILSDTSAVYDALVVIREALSGVKLVLPSIFRVRNGFKLRPDEESMISTVEEVFRYLLFVHVASAHDAHPIFSEQKKSVRSISMVTPLIRFVGDRSNISVVNVGDLGNTLDLRPLRYNPNWFVVNWDESIQGGGSPVAAHGSPCYVRSFGNAPVDRSHCVLLRGISVKVFESLLKEVNVMCKSGSTSRQRVLRALGYYALFCEDDSFITLATSVISTLDIALQVEFYREIAQVLDTSRYNIGSFYMERYLERILPMCLAIPNPDAWSPSIKSIMQSVDTLRLGSRSSGSVATLLRMLKSWCNVFVFCEDSCMAVFSKCIQLVVQSADDSRIVVRGAAADLAVQIWLNPRGKEAMLKHIGYETVRILGCVSGVQSIKFNIWSDLLSPDSGGTLHLERALARGGQHDAVYTSLHSEEAKFLTAMLAADHDVIPYLMDWYLRKYCKVTKTVLALEKIAIIIRFAITVYPSIERSGVSHASANVGVFCCWMLGIAIGCSVGSGCLELANVKMALFVDWLFFNYQYNSSIIRLCCGPDAGAQFALVLSGMYVCRRLLVKELAKCIYAMTRSDIADNEHCARLGTLLGASAVLGFACNTAVDTFKRLIDYLLNAILHYHSEVGIVAVGVMSSIFLVSVLDLPKTGYTSISLQRALRTTLLGRMCTALDIFLEGTEVHISQVEDLETVYLMQPKSKLEPLNDTYTMVAAVNETRTQGCYDSMLKDILLQCYAMVLEYVINWDSLLAVYQGNHLTSDTLRANYEMQQIEAAQCPRLYTNVSMFNSEVEYDSIQEFTRQSGESSDLSEMVSSSSLSDISTDFEDDMSPQDIGEIAIENLASCGWGFNKQAPVGENAVDLDPGMQSSELRQIVQDYVHSSMDDVNKDYARDKLYMYLKQGLRTGPPNYCILLDPLYSLKIVHPQGALEFPYHVANAIDVIVSYLMETALQCLEDDVNKGASVDSILFKEWVVHIFNVFIRLFVSLYLAGELGLLWELLYYMGALTNAVEQWNGDDDVGFNLRKRTLVATTLVVNTLDSIASVQGTHRDAVVEHAIGHVVQWLESQSSEDISIVMGALVPLRYTLQAIFKNSYEHLGSLAAVFTLMVTLTPISTISVLLPKGFNVFRNGWLDSVDSSAYLQSVLGGRMGGPLRKRQCFICWQLVCRMFEQCFATDRMNEVLNRDRGFLQVAKQSHNQRNIGRVRYFTAEDTEPEERVPGCLLGSTSSLRNNFMKYQRGYTFENELFSNERIGTISAGLLDAVREGELSIMQIAIFSSFPILVHTIPTVPALCDVVDAASLLWNRKRYDTVAARFMSDMLAALISSWLTRFPHLIGQFKHRFDLLPKAIDQLISRYTNAGTVQFTFNSTIVKVRVEHLALLKDSL